MLDSYNHLGFLVNVGHQNSTYPLEILRRILPVEVEGGRSLSEIGCMDLLRLINVRLVCRMVVD